MKEKLSRDELKELAAQLACPTGKDGIEISNIMNESNKAMTEAVITELAPMAGEAVIEIAPGNGVLSKPVLKVLGSTGRYLAVDLSKDMLTQVRLNLGQGIENSPSCEYILGNALELKLNTQFDKIYAVNFLYFIKDIKALMLNLSSWLNPGGKIVFGVRAEETLRKLPMTEFGFEYHHNENIKASLINAGFKNVKIETMVEETVVKRQVHLDFKLITHIISGQL